jgi:RHS repeat-associated protein
MGFEIDDLTIHIFNYTDGDTNFITLFRENFERFKDGRFPKNSGWQGLLKIKTGNDFSNDTLDSISVQSESVNGNKSLKINNSERNPFIVVKQFNIPENFPFDTSDRPFGIRYNEDMEAQNSQESVISRHEAKSLYNNLAPSTLACDQKNIHGPNTGGSFGSPNSNSRFGTIQSTSTVDTYYIYSFDGNLMAEYDHDGNCVKDYIYAGNRLIAEYQPQAGKYYYYMSDEINSTRIVTDDNGNVVYSEAYGPFGGVQKNWTKTYEPKLKFSGKEREAYGDLDYFGGRYFDHNSYRFISTDPIINREEALSNPQLWNLYSYCRNNPITFTDPDGRAVVLGGFLAVKGLEWLGVAIAAVVGAKAIHDTWPKSYEYPDNIVPVDEVVGPWDPTKDPISVTPILDLMDRVIQTSAKNQDEYDKHIRKYDKAKKQLKNLNDKLKNTKGPKKQKPIKEAIKKLKDDIKGHLKEIKQKWPTGRPG